jgi:hypothetical protein
MLGSRSGMGIKNYTSYFRTPRTCLSVIQASFFVATLYDRVRGRQPRKEKAAKQQYLNPHEENPLVTQINSIDHTFNLSRRKLASASSIYSFSKN